MILRSKPVFNCSSCAVPTDGTFQQSLETLDEADEYLVKLPEDSYLKNFETRSFALRE